MEWTTPIQYVKGVGEKRAALFAKLDIRTVRDLLAHYPRDYEDWSHPLTIGEAPYGKPCCIRAHVTSPVQEYRVRKGLVLYKFTVSDGREGMHVTLYNVKYTAEKLGKYCLSDSSRLSVSRSFSLLCSMLSSKLPKYESSLLSCCHPSAFPVSIIRSDTKAASTMSSSFVLAGVIL